MVTLAEVPVYIAVKFNPVALGLPTVVQENVTPLVPVDPPYVDKLIAVVDDCNPPISDVKLQFVEYNPLNTPSPILIQPTIDSDVDKGTFNNVV